LIVPPFVGFNQALVAYARTFQGMRETSKNSGPHIDGWLALVHLPPGFAWCMAFGYAMVAVVCADFHVPNPLPISGNVLRALAGIDPRRYRDAPAPGYGYFLDHGHGLGHFGFVCTLDPDGKVDDEISGNTFDDRGGREGNAVAVHHGPPELTHGGVLRRYVDFSPDALEAARVA
jgi:hypothetical protein